MNTSADYDLGLHNTDSPDLELTNARPPIVTYTLIGILILLAIFGLVTNGAVMILPILDRKMRYISYLTMVNLALSDFLFSLLTSPLYQAKILLNTIPICRATLFFAAQLSIQQQLNQFLVALWRLILVVSPSPNVLAKWGKWMKIMMVGSWIYTCSLTGLSYIKLRSPNRYNCVAQTNLYRWQMLIAIAHPAIFAAAALGIYIYILLHRRRATREIHGATTTANNHRDERALTKTMAIIFIVFVVCYIPYYYVFVYHIILWNKDYLPSQGVQILVLVGGLFNSCCNPVVYVLRVPIFKQKILFWMNKMTGRESRAVAALHQPKPNSGSSTEPKNSRTYVNSSETTGIASLP